MSSNTISSGPVAADPVPANATLTADDALLAADEPILMTDAEVESHYAMLGTTITRFLRPLASLRLTVTLFGMAIFIVLAGTLAQVDKDIWQVIHEYFRVSWKSLGFAWIELQIFFPPSFFPGQPRVPGGFYFPGGWLIGTLMAINLLAAHGIRFTAQAKGFRLQAGLGVIALGMLMTWLVVISGANKEGIQDATWLPWSTLWILFQGGLAAVWLGLVYLLVMLKPEQKIARWSLITTAALLGGLLAWLVYQGDAARLSDSSMRILWQLVKGTFAGGVLLAGCMMVFKKRAGIVLLHGGIGLMMLSEVLVGTLAVEAQMPIDEGQTINYVQDIRALELAVVDTVNPEQDDVVVVPEHFLTASQNVIQHDDLPFDVHVVKFLKNSSIRNVKPGDDNPATRGAGLNSFVEEARPGAGTDTGGEVDVGSMYVKFTEKNGSADFGTYLMSVYLKEQPVTVGAKTYNVQLRFKRMYKPYSMHLIDVRKDDYLGTNTPKNYSSLVRLVDETRNVDREINIWMNNPLRFAGETFYQSNYHRDPMSGTEATTLSVVTNTGWMIPYVSCMLVATGMLAHFSIVLLRFLNRRTTEQTNRRLTVSPTDASLSRRERKMLKSRNGHGSGNGHGAGELVPKRQPQPWTASRAATLLLPLAVVLVFAGWLGGKVRPPSTPPGEMNLYEFGRLPLLSEGRVKPIDTLARNSLQTISEKQTFVDANGNKQPAIRWFLDLIADPPRAFEHKVFRIENLEVLDTLELERRKGYRYSLKELQPRWEELLRQAEMAHKTDPRQANLYQKKILELESKIGVIDLLMKSFNPPRIRPEHAREDFVAAIQQQRALLERKVPPPLAIPPQSKDDTWETYASAWTKDLVHGITGEERNPGTESMTKMLIAYADNDAETFNKELRKYRAAFEEDPPLVSPEPNPETLNLAKTNFETFFNHFEPFYHSAVLYVVAFMLACLAWLGWSGPLNRASFWLIVFTLAVHTFALVARIYISGRPPVTNLYSSAVFIGWGAVILGLILELVYRIGIGNIIAAVSGFATLLIAHFLSIGGDTFTVLQAVLDTQFWLATHVTCITLGYSTTYVAGLLGVLYILRGVFTPSLTPQVGRDLSRMIYGTLCFAIFFSFVGTVLGGLWADDSWGRFWGWDPKENGALIIVLWNALVLHARWGGMVKERGLALLAVGGNIAVSWSWFGVNELGVGLHSYGFTEGVLLALGIFCLSQLALIGIGSLPKEAWWSYRRQHSV